MAIPGSSAAQLANQRVASDTQDILNLTFVESPLGEAIPTDIRLVEGDVAIVDKDGQRMLRASSRTTFLVSLPEALPVDFTVEFDVIPKTCCNPEDIGFEGTLAINQGQFSSNVLWHHERLQVVGGGATFDQRLPEAIAATLPGARTKVTFQFQGETMHLLVNDQPAHTLSDRKFVRGRVLRVFLGGQDSGAQAVYLARLRVAAGVDSGVRTSTQPINPAAVPSAPLTAAPVNTAASAVPQPAAPSQRLTPPTRAPGRPTLLGTGPAPANLKAYPTPTTAILVWDPVPGATGYTVQRTLQGSMTGSTTLTSTRIKATQLSDLLPDATKTYTYTVLAHQADGTYGQASVDLLAAAPGDPSKFSAISPRPGVVELSWAPYPRASAYLVTGPGIAPNVTVEGTKHVVTDVPTGVHTYRVASAYPSAAMMTPPDAWPTATVAVAGESSVPFLTLTNGPGTLAEYNRHACAAGQWLSGQQPWLNSWCELPAANSVAAVQAWPLLGLFGIQEYQFAMGRDLITGAPYDIYQPANEWTQFWLWRWAQGNNLVPEASFHDDNDLDRDRRVGCVQRGSGASAATMCWASSTPGALSVIVQSQQESYFLLFQDTPADRVYPTDCPEPPRWWEAGNSDWRCGKLLGIPNTNLDSKGARFAPHACLACHGGKFDSATGKVVGASLLPLDPRGFSFSNPNTRAAQEETIRQINLAIFNSQAPTLVRNYVTDLYRGRQAAIGTAVDDDYVPPGWASEPAVYRDIYRPYCASCHNAQQGALGFAGWDDLVREKVRVQQAVCNARSMPHAEVPFKKFWTDGAAKWPGTLMAALGYPAC